MPEPTIKESDALTVAFVAVQGPYAQMPMMMGKLYGWLQGRGYTPEGMPMAVYLTDPAQVPEAQAMWEIWAPIGDSAEELPADAEGLGVRYVPPATVASLMYKGPYEGMGPAYEHLASWISQQGYAVAGPSREVYFSDPETTAPEDYLTEVQFPVAVR